MKQCLLSVSDKTGLVPFATQLIAHGWRLISTGGSARHLREAGLEVTDVSSLTGFPEIFNGRVKTLHPKVHGGILGRRDQDQAEAEANAVDWIDMVVVNLYPFSDVFAKTEDDNERIENIDIGGPTLIRAAAKNHAWVTVVVDPSDYDQVLAEHETLAFRKKCAGKAFALVALYDSLIAEYLQDEAFPETLTLGYRKVEECRYGENPHQRAAVYRNNNPRTPSPLLDAVLHQGKAMSYNNLNDAQAALNAIADSDAPTCAVIKHANPCGMSTKADIDQAFDAAWDADARSAFGGIVALNRPCTEYIAQQLTSRFFEVILAPEYTDEALTCFAKKPNCRVLSLPSMHQGGYELRSITGGLLIQETGSVVKADQLEVVTSITPSDEAMQEALFAFQVVRAVKSNAIVITRDRTTLGIGPGQVSRVGAVEIALRQAPEDLSGAVLASDAFFPFPDSIEHIANTAIKTIIQPGGSKQDPAVIQACDHFGIAMIFTGQRVFSH